MIIFVSATDAKDIYLNSGYLSNLGKEEKRLRLVNSPGNDIINVYRHGFLEWTDHDKTTIHEYIRRLKDLDDGLGVTCIWKFIKLDHRLEWGYPQTINDCIVISNRLLQKINSREVIATLVHEQIHVQQRRYPDWFRKLYHSWGFRQTSSIRIPQEIHDELLTNPDGMSRNWIIYIDSKWYLPLAKANHQLVLGQLEHHGGKFTLIGLSEDQLLIKKYLSLLPVHRQAYHPNEISAHYLTSMLCDRGYFE